ncbi:hypothetical protein CDAR_23271 [Caerostris darwini]|uniref:Uncharacterized protein n=1 Tax=Caerostris darwini TaxID=1538125 RepID=A0AAV4U883_9ARAC|nr:hypothetical protein CDAR_23241 [Caerostris darwini]GIY53980.1 hypothetical protein CDAR_23271 [Caerostris darwini]
MLKIGSLCLLLKRKDADKRAESALFQPLAGFSSSQRLKDHDPFESFRRRIKSPGSGISGAQLKFGEELNLGRRLSGLLLDCLRTAEDEAMLSLSPEFECRLLKDDSGNE